MLFYPRLLFLTKCFYSAALIAARPAETADMTADPVSVTRTCLFRRWGSIIATGGSHGSRLPRTTGHRAAPRWPLSAPFCAYEPLPSDSCVNTVVLPCKLEYSFIFWPYLPFPAFSFR